MAFKGYRIESEDLERRFTFHNVDEGTRQEMSRLRGLHLELAREIVDNIPPGREASLAITALEESSMWSIAALARAADD